MTITIMILAAVLFMFAGDDFGRIIRKEAGMRTAIYGAISFIAGSILMIELIGLAIEFGKHAV